MPTFKPGCIVLLLMSASACGGSNSTTSPTPTPTPTTFSLTGQVADSTTSTGIPGATVSIADGSNAGKSATTDGSGNYSFTGLQSSGFTVNVSANGYVSSSKSMTLTANQTLSFQLTRVPITPSTFTLNGMLTDGTSHGILPNITIQIVSGTNVGKSAVTDGSGNYVMSGLSAGTFTLSVSATSYQTTTQQVTLTASTRVDLVLQRVTPPTISSLTVSCKDSTLAYRGSTTQCTATAHYSDGSSAVPASGVTWQSSNTAAATVDSTGLVTTIALAPAKTAFITATFQGLSASFQLTLKGCGIIVPSCL
jgi:hypothetical protein